MLRRESDRPHRDTFWFSGGGDGDGVSIPPNPGESIERVPHSWKPFFYAKQELREVIPISCRCDYAIAGHLMEEIFGHLNSSHLQS